MLKKFIFSLSAVLALSLAVIAQDGKDVTKDVTFEGYITDTKCAASKVAKASDPTAAAADHGKGCVLGCAADGLGVYAGGKFTQFDAKGAELAKAALEKSKKDKGAKFKVTGKVTGDKMTVATVEEIQ